MRATPSPGVTELIALGFSELEAEVYVFLLRESPATGYRVAQAIGRTAANTYKTLESLEAQGAIMVEESESRLCRAVSPRELLSGLEATFTRQRSDAAETLSKVITDHSDDRVYQLKTPTQVFERCRSILGDARQVVLVDIFPRPLDELHAAIAKAIARGVRVAILAYEPAELPGATVVLNHQAPTVRSRWAGHWVNIAADSAEHVNALLTPDLSGVVHATWSASAFLSHLYHCGLLGELALSAVHSALRARRSPAAIARVLRDIGRFEHQDTPAFAALTRAPLRRGRPRGRPAQ
jgi:sugar-specific transcriptional regulator TrmB